MDTQKNKDENRGQSQGTKDALGLYRDKKRMNEDRPAGANEHEDEWNTDEGREQRPYQGIQNSEPQYKEDKSHSAYEDNPGRANEREDEWDDEWKEGEDKNEGREQRPYKGVQNTDPQYKDDKSHSLEDKKLSTDQNQTLEDLSDFEE